MPKTPSKRFSFRHMQPVKIMFAALLRQDPMARKKMNYRAGKLTRSDNEVFRGRG